MIHNTRLAASVHILAYLAYQKGRAVPSVEIAGSANTNPVVVRRLLAALLKARLVTAQKGAGGGFRLASAPENISLLEVYRAVEPQPNHAMRKFVPNHRCPVGGMIGKIIEGAFFKAQSGMEAELARITLADVDQEVRGLCPAKR